MSRIAAAAVLTLLSAAPAQAATVTVTTTSDGRVAYRTVAVRGDAANDAITARTRFATIDFQSAQPISVHGDPGCQGVDANTVRCDLTADFNIDLGAGDDRADLTGVARMTVSVRTAGGAGDDVLVGGPSYDELIGGPGRDRLVGGALGDRLYDGDGTSASPDVYEGGDGRDEVRYEGAQPVVADLGRGVSDRAGARDALASVETLFAGEGDDVLTGSAQADGLYGGGGSDRISGLDGDDELLGGSSRSRVLGGAGNDRVWGGGRGSLRNGGPGNDNVTGDGGHSIGGTGDDLITARKRGSSASCGAGADMLVPGDHALAAAADCERVVDMGTPAMPARPRRTARFLVFTATCIAGCFTRLTFSAHAGRTLIARREITMGSRASRTYRVRLTRAGRRMLARDPRRVLRFALQAPRPLDEPRLSWLARAR